MAVKYTTTTELGNMLGIIESVPSWDVSNEPTNEAVGTGDNAETQFYLDQKNIVADSYTLYADAVGMTETTHYSLDLTTGEITLTGPGVTLLDTDALTAKYKYFNNGMTDAYLNTVLQRSEAEVDARLNTTFTDGTATNPTYPQEIEIQPSEGYFLDRIITYKKPLIDVTTTLDGAHDASQNTVDVASGDGASLPTSGYIIVGSEVISYTGITTDQLTGCTRGALSTTAATHDDGDDVHTTILFRSDTDEGTVVSYTVQPWGTSTYATDTGLLYKYNDADPDPLIQPGVADRVKIIYYYGGSTVPLDITRLGLLFAKRMLIQDNIGKSMIAGRNEFRPEMLNADMEEINRIVNSHIVYAIGNT